MKLLIDALYSTSDFFNTVYNLMDDRDHFNIIKLNSVSNIK